LRGGVVGLRRLPPAHGGRGHVPGDRAGPDTAPPRAAHQDRSARCPETRSPVSGGRADADPRARRGGGSCARPGAVSRGGAARCRALAPSPPEAARSARPALGGGEELDAAGLELAPRPALRAAGAARRVGGGRGCARRGAGPTGGARPRDRGLGADGAVSGPRRVAALLPRHRHAVGDGAAGRDRGLPTLPPAPRAHGLPGAGAERVLLRRDPAAWGSHESRQHTCPARADRGPLALSAPPDGRPRAGEPEPGAARGGRRAGVAGATAVASALPPSHPPRPPTAPWRRRARPARWG